MIEIHKAVASFIKERGQISPSELVTIAEPVDSPIHSAFEWDDGIAGHKYRLYQARNIIRQVTVIIENRVEKLVHVPVIRAEGYYKPMSRVAKSSDEFPLALKEILKQLMGIKKAYEELKQARSLKYSEKAEMGFKMIMEALTEETP